MMALGDGNVAIAVGLSGAHIKSNLGRRRALTINREHAAGTGRRFRSESIAAARDRPRSFAEAAADRPAHTARLSNYPTIR